MFTAEVLDENILLNVNTFHSFVCNTCIEKLINNLFLIVNVDGTL